ncbi:MAG TPA: alpha-N-acetylglucosaminidase [Puia sp.]|nr:alpha-N-acetylglucosaminidase [Puia sp.]
MEWARFLIPVLMGWLSAGSLLAQQAYLPPGGKNASPDKQASYALIHRLLAGRSSAFIVEELPQAGGVAKAAGESIPNGKEMPQAGVPAGKDVFELESRGQRIVIRGNNGVAIASGLYYYLENYCHCQLTWNGSNMRLPAKLPLVAGKIHRSSPYNYRYYLNYCTFNYSMSWWDWARWEKEIDWMALHGINMPLAITGEEYTWYTVYKEMGFTEEELAAFFSGPAYFSWFWMGNLDGWGGPLTLHWMEGHRDLQAKILERERALGMKPVLPAFTGHVPAAFRQHYPTARLKQTNWKNGFPDTYILDSEDALFAEIGKKFLEKQSLLFGTDHLYSADTFNENEPPSDDPAFLAGLSKRLYEGMQQADPAAIWVMQGWLFYSDRKFWKAPQIKALLDAVPDDHMILLDLAAEIEPVWKRTDAFYGKPWIWNMLNNFGGNVNLFGRMDGVASGPALALKDTASRRLAGIGLTMEAIEQNPVIYELMMEHAWQSKPVVVEEWLHKYVRNRYGMESEELLRAWDILRRTVYNGREIRDGAESILTGRPTFDSTTVWTRTKLNYPPQSLLPAWDLFIRASGGQAQKEPGKGLNEERSKGQHPLTEGFLFDLTDITRQVLANYALPLQKKWVEAFHAGDSVGFRNYSGQFIELISDMDLLLSTRTDFLLGPWIASARSWGNTPAEKQLYEMNARDLITLWGDANSPLHEYANRQWSGLLNDFYKVRWQKFFSLLESSLEKGVEPDVDAFEKEIRGWEWGWVNEQKSFPVVPSGSSLELCGQLYRKYRQAIGSIY